MRKVHRPIEPAKWFRALVFLMFVMYSAIQIYIYIIKNPRWADSLSEIPLIGFYIYLAVLTHMFLSFYVVGKLYRHYILEKHN